MTIDDVFAAANITPPTAYLLARSYDGYETNLPVADLVGGKAMIATRFGGKPLEAEPVKAMIADAELRLNGTGRLVVRASGTEPLIRIMAEGDDEKLVNQVVKEIAGAVRKAAA